MPENLESDKPESEAIYSYGGELTLPMSKSGVDPQPEHIGPYRILQKLGEGGFGIVYLAERTEPLRRRVAIKIIKPGMDSLQILARFQAEEQALALMDHPCVAKVLDAGVTVGGRSYFVMEHVPGISITQHCDQNRLSVRKRIDLFIRVCEAVQHAHQKGIIHRDIKPSNILVAVQDSRVTPKVIDFGVAKALHQPLTEQTIYTPQGQMVGTPVYMSPEQAEMTAQDIDTRSDIYSLGVLLYELLTGKPPFDRDRMRTAPLMEIQRIIREEEPVRPSTRLSGLGEDTQLRAKQSGVDPRTLIRDLRGDLDWIIMKCMEKDRTRRYASASALVDDLRRHLADEPVLAGPPSTAYRFRKFARRHRAGIVAAGLAILALISGLVVASVGLYQASVQRDAALEAQAESARQADIAAAVNEFLNQDLLAMVAPSGQAGRGKDVTMRTVLDTASDRIEQAAAPNGKFDDKPLVEAAVRLTLGRTYHALGEYQSAQRHLERALSIQRREHAADHRETVIVLTSLGLLLLEQGQLEQAEAYLRESADHFRNVEHDDDPILTASVINSLGGLLHRRGELDEAETLFRDLLARQRVTFGSEHQATLLTLNNLAAVLSDSGQLEAAEPFYREALGGRLQVLGADHEDTMLTLGNMGVLLQRTGQLAEAEDCYRRAWEGHKRVFGDDHVRTISAQSNLALLLVDRDQAVEAERLAQDAVDKTRTAIGTNNWLYGNFLGKLGRAQTALGKFEEADRSLTDAMAILSAALGTNHEQTKRVAGYVELLNEKRGNDESQPQT